MGRVKIKPENKKRSISIALDKDVYNTLDELDIKNKSKLINWILKEHFNLIEKGGLNDTY